jgi:hypothetical protein
VYSPAVGAWIAEAYASGDAGTTLRELHLSAPERVPGPLVLARWRSAWPAFGALMDEAERVRAASLMEATLPLADAPGVMAASAKNQIAARWRMAECLDPDRFGQRRTLAVEAGAGMGGGVRITDAQLLAIIQGQDARLVLDVPPTAPPVRSETPEARGSEVVPASHAFQPQESPAARVPSFAALVREKISADSENISEAGGEG